MNAPHVLLSGVVLGQPMGGVRRHNQELLPRVARLLEARGGSLRVLEGTEPVAFELPSSVERIASRVPARPPMARAWVEGRALEAVVRESARSARAVDLVHTAHLPAPRSLSVPYSLTIHDLRHAQHGSAASVRRFLAQRILRGGALGASALVVVSAGVRDELCARFGAPRARVHVVPNAADHFRPEPRAVPADAALLHLGHLEPRKNLELLLEALACDPELPDLELVGLPKADHAERLRLRARELGVEGRVRFLGPCEDAALPALFARAACLVMPSRLEGFGIPVLEAQRAGVPVAIARAGALPEVAGEKVPRFAIDDPRACAAAIRRALEATPETLERGRRNAERFAWDRSAAALFTAWCAAARRD